jgi:hypothetical protein
MNQTLQAVMEQRETESLVSESQFMDRALLIQTFRQKLDVFYGDFLRKTF